MPHTIPTVTLAWLLFTSTLWGLIPILVDLVQQQQQQQELDALKEKINH